MPHGQRPSKTAGLWDVVASGVGYHLDNFGRWLLASAPRLGGAYASLIAPGEPQPCTQPNWRFAYEYYEQRRWMACRRGALWEAAGRSRSKSDAPPQQADTKTNCRIGCDVQRRRKVVRPGRWHLPR